MSVYVDPETGELVRDGYTPELADLMEHEKVIEQGLATFVDVGAALVAIRDGKKYRHAGYDTFEAYCRDRWGFDRTYAHRIMAAAETAALLDETDPEAGAETLPIGNVLPAPARESQLRPLAPLARQDPEAAREAWRKAVDDADGGQPTAKQVEQAAKEVVAKSAPDRPPITKPDLGGGVSHPARYSDALLPVFAAWLQPGWIVLDPFAGTGRVHELRHHVDRLVTVGVELEPEWANLHPDTIVGNALDLPYDDESFDAIVTSPTYGNRLADSHNATDPELRRSYTHDLGRKLHEDNSGSLQWGAEYRTFHEAAWCEAVRVLRSGGLFLLNIKDHVRNGQVQDVSAWHADTLIRGHGMRLARAEVVGVPSLRQGANGEARVGHEFVWVMRKQ